MKTKKLVFIITSVIVLTLLIFVACDKRVLEVPEYYIQNIIANPNTIYPDNNLQTYSEISVTVVDKNDIPLAGKTVTFKVLADTLGNFLGNITSSSNTGNNGVALAQFHDNGQIGTATVEASIAGVKQTVVVYIIPIPDPSLSSISQLIAYPDTIYADANSATYSEIRVFLIDENGFPAVGDTVFFQTNPNLGYVTASAYADQYGIARAQFRDIGIIGDAVVQAFIPDTTATVVVRIIGLPSCYIDTLIAIPDSIYADGNDATYSEIEAYIRGEDGFPVEGYPVSFQTDFGSVEGSAGTDITGKATAKFYDNGNLGIATIQASIEDTTTSVQVRIIEPPSYHIERIDADPDTIYADNNITFSLIEVLVKDDQGFAVTGEMVSFRTDLGNILAHIYTDSSGIAETTFWDNGEVGVATIEAFVGDATAEVTVWIEEIPEIDPDEFYIDINTNDINIDEVILVRAHAKNTLGVFVPDGTIIVFQTTKGFFQTFDAIPLGTVVQATTTSGIAQTYFNAGTQADVSILSALISDLIVTENITIHPGSPKNMFLTSLNENGEEQYIIPVNSNEILTIQAKVQDKYGNLVESGLHSVNFETTLGTIQPAISPIDSGYAFSQFSPGITSGIAEISAVSDSATATAYITVTSDDVYSIEFDFSGQIDIHVQGTGGQESFELVVNLYDMNGNFIDESLTVWFQLMSYPAGTNINNVGVMDSTQATNGQAFVAINSGTTAGTASVKAWTFNEQGVEISATKSHIVVHAGPTNSIDISVGDQSTGVNVGGGYWSIECAAILNDFWGNPVHYGTVVWFSLPEAPSWATITAESYVGNVNTNGDSLDGIAYTSLIFEGSHTNEQLLIKVESAGVDSGVVYTDSTYITLPIQYPIIDLAAVPQHLDWVIAGDMTPKETTIHVQVLDGQNNPLDGVELIFETTLGEPINALGQPDYFGITGEIDGVHGRVNKIVQYQKYECPPPTLTGPGETTGTVTVKILGSQVMNSIDIILKRYVD